MIFRTAAAAALLALARAQRGGGGGNGGRGNNRPDMSDIDPCMNISDQTECEDVMDEQECGWGQLPPGLRQDGETMGCRSACFFIEEEADCTGVCRWGTPGGNGGGRGRRRLQRGGGGGGGGNGGNGGGQARCRPAFSGGREEVTTGLMLTTTFYTDENCTDKYEVGDDDGDRRRLQGGGRGGGPGGRGGGGGGGRGPGGRGPPNRRQGNRIFENPTMRMLPVVDDEMNPKCSADAQVDRNNNVYRMSKCSAPGVIDEETFEDAECTTLSRNEDNDVIVRTFTRGACVPLPQRMAGNNDRRRGGGGVGRRLSEEMMDDLFGDDYECDGEYETEGGMTMDNMFDWLGELMCDLDGDDEEEVDPCEGLGIFRCRQEDACTYSFQSGVCVWDDAP